MSTAKSGEPPHDGHGGCAIPVMLQLAPCYDAYGFLFWTSNLVLLPKNRKVVVCPCKPLTARRNLGRFPARRAVMALFCGQIP